MPDISIDEAKAKMWMNDVNAEIDAVEGILKSTNSALTSTVDNEDSIMNGIYNVGTAMENAWNHMCGVFHSVHDKMRDAIEKTVSTAQTVIEDTDSLKSKF